MEEKQEKAQKINIFALALQQFEQRRKGEEELLQLQNNANSRELTRQNAQDGADATIEKISSLNDGNPSENTLIVCGSQNCGKTSLINRFLDIFSGRNNVSTVQTDQEKTIALEYRFGRRMTHQNEKQLVHLWELAGGGAMASLLEVALTPQNIHTTSILLFFDLTRPEWFQSLIESIIPVCRKRIEKLLSDEKINGGKSSRIPSADRQIVRLLGMSIVFICARYDEFQNLDNERKRLTYRQIRLLAHINGAEILTLSLRMDSLLQKARSTMLHLATNLPFHPLPKLLSTDPQQPLFVMPYGADSIKTIDPSLSLSSYSEAMLHALQALNQMVPQQKLQAPTEEDEADDEAENPNGARQFVEPDIDNLVAERMRQLELFAREKHDRLEAEKRAAERRLID